MEVGAVSLDHCLSAQFSLAYSCHNLVEYDLQYLGGVKLLRQLLFRQLSVSTAHFCGHAWQVTQSLDAPRDSWQLMQLAMAVTLGCAQAVPMISAQTRLTMADDFI